VIFHPLIPLYITLVKNLLNIDNNENMDLKHVHVYQGLLGVYIYGYRGRLRVNKR
jgi:hypothetical protein